MMARIVAIIPVVEARLRARSWRPVMVTGSSMWSSSLYSSNRLLMTSPLEQLGTGSGKAAHSAQ